jgi:hypothetical protein
MLKVPAGNLKALRRLTTQVRSSVFRLTFDGAAAGTLYRNIVLSVELPRIAPTCLAAEVSRAQLASTTTVPNLINYSGTLHLPSGLGSPAQVVGVTFAIYRQQDGGAPLWLETQNVTPDSTGQAAKLLIRADKPSEQDSPSRT